MYDLKSMFNKDEMLTHEMIHSQSSTNIAFLVDLRKSINYIKDVIIRNDLRNATLLTDGYAEARKEIDNISTILTNRFKFNIKVLVSSDGGANTSTIVPGKFNVLSGSTDWHDGVKKYFLDKSGNGYKDIKSIADFTKNVEDYYNQIYKNIKAMEREIDKFNITIDNKNATITGLPKDFVNMLKMDFCYLLNKKGRDLSVDGFISIILHEIGHFFTTMEKTVSKVKNSVTLLEAVKDTIGSGIKDQTALLKIVSKKMGGTTTFVSGNNSNPNNDLLAEIYLKYNANYGEDINGVLSRTESEKQADLFVSRFGLGGAFATSLLAEGAWVRYHNKDMENSIEIGTWVGFYMIIFVAVFAASAPLSIGIPLLIGNVIGQGLGFTIMINRYISKARNYFKHENKYELDYQRVLRFKQDNIRQIRLLDKKEDKELLERISTNIEILNERLSFIKTMEEQAKKNSYLKRILIDKQFDDKTKSILNMSDLVQELMENELHLKSTKL